MRTLLYIFSVRNAIKRKKDLFSLKRSAICAMAKNNLLKRFATSARAEVAQLALCASNCGMPTSEHLSFYRTVFHTKCYALMPSISPIKIYYRGYFQIVLNEKFNSYIERKIEEDCEVSLRSSSQQAPVEYDECDRFQPRIEPVT